MIIDSTIDHYVAAVAALPPHHAALRHPEPIVARLGGHARRVDAVTWSIAFDGGVFAGATAALEHYADEATIRVTFHPRAGNVPLAALVADRAHWTLSAPMPDSGQRQIARQWFDLPSRLSVSCSIPLADDGQHARGDVTCFVGEV